MNGRAGTGYFVLLCFRVASADPPPGEKPAPVTCAPHGALKAGRLLDGHYVGEEPMETPKGADEGSWFHQVIINIEGGKVSTEEMPLAYADGERHESASDGGFYTFEGCVVADSSRDHFNADLHLTSWMYGDRKMAGPRSLTLKASGRNLLVNGKLYWPVAKPRRW